jgi:membrane associated rhomboid family serine protease
MRITLGLLVANVVVFAMQALFGPAFQELFALTPELAINSGYVWQFVTYMFLHGGFMHITFNMFVLFMFGTVIEHSLGEKKYLVLYFASGVGSALFYILLMGISDIPMLGASGAIFGILAAYGFMFPKNTVFVFPGIPVPAILAVVGLAAFELFSGIMGTQPGIANFGHLGGIITGIMIMFYWKQSITKRVSRSSDARREFEYFWE